MNAVISGYEFDLAGNRFYELVKEQSRRRCIGPVKKPGKGDLRSRRGRPDFV
jgi:hypothetical protein